MKPFLLAVSLWLTVTFGCAAPSGSGPVTYHMLSTRDFLVGTDGTVYTRIVPSGATNYFTNIYQTFNYATNVYSNVYQSFNYVTNLYTNVTQTFTFTTNYYTNVLQTFNSVTNYFTNVYQEFSFTTNVFTNLYQTFNNVTNFYTNLYQTFNIVTNVYTNVYQTFNSVTNLYENSFISYSNSYVTINGTNLAVVNPTDNYLPKRNSATNFVDSLAHDDGTVFSVDGTGTSFVRLESDNGEVVFGTGATNILYRYVNSLMYSFDGVSGYLGATNPLGWIKIGTVSGSPAISASSTIFVDQQAVTHSINPALDNTYSLGDGSSVGAWADLFSKGYYYSEGFNDGLGNQSWLTLHHSGTNGSAIFNSHGAGTAGPARPISLEFEGVNLFQFDRLGQITFGPGITNVLYRSGTDLVYTNGDADVRLTVLNGSNSGLSLEAQGTDAVLSSSGVANGLTLRVPTAHATLFGHAFYPTTDGAESLGSVANRWKDVHSMSTNFVWGYAAGPGYANFSRLALSQSGDGGLILFDAQSGGTGTPGTFQFTNAVVHVDSTKGLELGGVTRTTWNTVNNTIPQFNVFRASDFTVTNLFFTNMATAAWVDLWDVPANMYAVVTAAVASTTNTSTGNVQYFGVKTNGVYEFTKRTAQSISTNNPSDNRSTYVYESGETVCVTNTKAGNNLYLTAKYWPKASVSYIKPLKARGTVAGATNLIYTCPPGVAAYAFEFNQASIFVDTYTSFITINGSSSANTLSIYRCPTATVPDDTTRIYTGPSTAMEAKQAYVGVIYPGDSIYYSSDTTDSDVGIWMNVLESTFPPTP